MLEISIPQTTVFDEKTESFYEVNACKICLEHSLISVSKWESKWHLPFIDTKNKTNEMMIDYIRCMTVSKSIDPYAYYTLTPDHISKINSYIEDPMTATTFSKNHRASGRERVTSELIYYWMISLGIPVEFEKWHLNRLLTLIRLCEEKNQPPKKMSRNAILKQNKSLNAARRAKYHSRG